MLCAAPRTCCLWACGALCTLARYAGTKPPSHPHALLSLWLQQQHRPHPLGQTPRGLGRARLAGPRGSRYLSLLWGRLCQAVRVHLCLPSLQHPLRKKSRRLGPPSEHRSQPRLLTLWRPATPLGLPVPCPSGRHFLSYPDHPPPPRAFPPSHPPSLRLSGPRPGSAWGLCCWALLSPSRDVATPSPSIPLG